MAQGSRILFWVVFILGCGDIHAINDAQVVTDGSATDAATDASGDGATVGPPASLRFDVQPANTAPNTPLMPAVKVAQFDDAGNKVTGVTSTITIAIGTNPGNGTLTGTLSAATTSGTATFDDLEIDQTGNGYTLVASSGALMVTSDPFNVRTGLAQPPTNLTATAGAESITLSWTASTLATSYNVLRSTTSGSGYASIGNTTGVTFSDGNATTGTYYYVVQSVNAAGTSGNSNEASATIGRQLCVVNSGNNSIVTLLAASNGNATPLRLISGASTGLALPHGIAADITNDEYVVANYNANTITVHSRTATGDASPVRTVSGLGRPFSVAVDSTNNELFVADYNPVAIVVFARTATGTATPVRTISGTATGLMGPTDIALDLLNNEIAVANSTGQSITVYGRTANGNVAPTRTITGSSTSLNSPEGLAIDTTANEIFVANQASNSVLVFARNANGNAVPLRTLAGGATGLAQPADVAIDALASELLVVNYNGVNASLVTVYPRAANGNVAPSRTITGSATGLSGAWGIAFCR